MLLKKDSRSHKSRKNKDFVSYLRLPRSDSIPSMIQSKTIDDSNNSIRSMNIANKTFEETTSTPLNYSINTKGLTPVDSIVYNRKSLKKRSTETKNLSSKSNDILKLSSRNSRKHLR